MLDEFILKEQEILGSMADVSSFFLLPGLSALVYKKPYSGQVLTG
jgi:hypothetical protein